MFESFEQIRRAGREIGGTGLGPCITKQLVELQQGRIWVDCKLDEGSAFTMALPLIIAADDTSVEDLSHIQLANMALIRLQHERIHPKTIRHIQFHTYDISCYKKQSLTINE